MLFLIFYNSCVLGSQYDLFVVQRVKQKNLENKIYVMNFEKVTFDHSLLAIILNLLNLQLVMLLHCSVWHVMIIKKTQVEACLPTICFTVFDEITACACCHKDFYVRQLI